MRSEFNPHLGLAKATDRIHFGAIGRKIVKPACNVSRRGHIPRDPPSSKNPHRVNFRHGVSLVARTFSMSQNHQEQYAP